MLLYSEIYKPYAQVPFIHRWCPILYEIMQGKDDMGIYQSTVTLNDGSKPNGFALPITIDKDAPLLNCLTVEVSEAAFDLFDKCIKIYNALQDNPPFPAWKPGLNEVWN